VAFRPLPQKELTALQVEWEVRLKAAGEGPPEIRSLYQSSDSDGMHVVQLQCDYNHEGRESIDSVFSTEDSVVNTDTFQYWNQLADKVRALPITYPIFARAFLTAYAECGCIVDARNRVGISKMTAFRYLREFDARNSRGRR